MFKTPLCPSFPYVSVLIFKISPFFTSKYNKLFRADISSIRPSWGNIFQMFLLHCIVLSPQEMHTLSSLHVSQHLLLNCLSMSSGLLPSFFSSPPSLSLYLSLHLFNSFIYFCQKCGENISQSLCSMR